MSTVYLLHFTEPISALHTAQHYLGSTDSLDRRIAEHRAGTGARLPAVARERGISFMIARTWPGGRTVERRLKRLKNGPKLCGICSPVPRLPRSLLRA
jgi:predicted GIY-YIG superfamily endonuclease